MIFRQYPYHNFSDYNLDWVIYQTNKVLAEINDFIVLNSIKYANPIAWNITRQYEKNTVVIDPATGNAYLSVKAVPNGIAITNTDYWTPIFNYDESINELREQIVAVNEHDSQYATAARAKDELLWINGILYRVLYNINAGTRYIVDENIVETTVELEMRRISAYLNGLIETTQGNLDTYITNNDNRVYADETRITILEQTAGQYNTATYEIIGDSNCYGYGWQESEGQGVFKILAEKYPLATFRPVRVGLAWHGVSVQIQQVTEAPDVFILWCGGNDISNWLVGAVNLGYPDFNEYNLANFDTNTTYGAMNFTLGYIRKNFPTSKIVGVLRTYKADQSLDLQKSIYGTITAIYHKWKCAVINLNDFGQICDASVDQYSVLFTDAHYNETAYRKFVAPAFIGAIECGFDVNTHIDVETIYTDADPNTQYFDWTQIYRYFGDEMKTRGAIQFISRSGNFASVFIQKHGSDFMYIRTRTGFQSLEYRRIINGTITDAEVVQALTGTNVSNKDLLGSPNGIINVTAAEAASFTHLPVDNTPFMIIKHTNGAGLRYYIAVRYDGVLYTGVAGTGATDITWTLHT